MTDRSRRSRSASASTPGPHSTPGTVWDSIRLIPNPIPPIAREAIVTSTAFLQTDIRLPILLHPPPGNHATRALLRCAEVARANEIPLNLGDLEHLLIEQPIDADILALRAVMAGELLLGELRATSLVRAHNDGRMPVAQIKSLIASLGLGALVIWVDFADRALEGNENVDSAGMLSSLETIARQIEIPLLARAGMGFPRKTARALIDRGVAGLITGGAEVFGLRTGAVPSPRATTSTALSNWGIPTIAAVRMLRSIGVPVVTAGSIQHGMDAAKAIAIGADLVALTIPDTLDLNDTHPLEQWLLRFEFELKTTMFLAGVSQLSDLNHAPFVATGETREWLEAAEVLWRSDSGRA